jgi:Ca-activated chloride channel family protein
MAHVRSKAAVAMVAVLLTSCTGGDRPDTARQSEVPPQALESEALLAKSPAAVADSGLAVPPPPSAEQNVVVTGTRALRQDFNSPSPVATVTSSPPALAARSPGFEQRIAPPLYVDEGRDRFTSVEQNRFRVVGEEPVSTFSIDVDTASYGWMRASLNRNVLPQPDSVRTEELINYFPYDYARPASAEQPFSTRVDVFPSPWTEGRKLVRVGIRGYEVERATRPSANLVFLIDTSGSMSAPNKLGLVRQSLAMLVEQLGANDTVSIVTYTGNAGTALEPTRVSEKGRILAAIERLGAGGSTAGAEGIRQAYALAERNFDAESVNRVILATDGDFNVGITNPEELKGYVERQRGKGVFLSVLGFGMGNYNDALMQTLAQNGNGNAAYIDTLSEARKTLVEEATSTLFPIAKDVKIQVEFNPATVAEYRLIGYETRMLAREDFDNDKVDAGDVGSGQTVTAIYEIVPVGGARAIGDLRYSQPRPQSVASSSEYGFVKIRYKRPNSDRSQLISTPIDRTSEVRSFAQAPRDARFATGVASFAELLRGGRYSGTLTYDDVLQIVSAARGEDEFGYRSEFVQLVRAAKTASAMARLGQ